VRISGEKSVTRYTKLIGDEEFSRRLAAAPEVDVDEETIARILAAEAEHGESISHSELKQRLGL
jgi:hypothetical protein